MGGMGRFFDDVECHVFTRKKKETTLFVCLFFLCNVINKNRGFLTPWLWRLAFPACRRSPSSE